MKQLLTIGLLGFSVSAFAQNVGIGTSTPNASAKLEISSTNSGVLIPRVSLTNVSDGTTPVATPATGVLVYNTNAAVTGGSGTGFYYWNGFIWRKLQDSASNDWTLTGNGGTNAAINFLGTADAVDMVVRTNNIERMRILSGGNVGIGTNAPNTLLTVRTTNATANARTTSLVNAISDPMFEMVTTRGGTTNNPGEVMTQIGQAYNGGVITDGFRFHRGIIGTDGAISAITNSTERMRILSNGNVGIAVTNPAYGLELGGSFGYGSGIPGSYRSRTESRDNAGQIATQSGFFETANPVNYPAGATSWWHLIDVRHSNSTNNYAMQISGSFFDQDIWYRKTNNNAAQAWSRFITSSNLNTQAWTLLGNFGTNAGTNFIGTTDAVDFVTRTNNTERMRVTSGGNVGIGITIPTQRLDVQGGNARINNAFVGDVGHGAAWGGFAHSNQANTNGYSLLASTDGQFTFINKLNTNSGYIGFRVSNVDQAVILNNGFMGIGTTAPAARLQVLNGSIRPHTGNDATSGIYWTPNPGGGGGDEAYIRHYVEAGENTKLVIANVNDSDDDISFRTGLSASERVQISGNGTVYLNRGVFFDCNDCGSTAAGSYEMADGAGGNYGDLSIQGRVLSANSNIHLSPPGGSRVVIDGNYRAAGGGTGQVGLDVDGGIRMRKNYAYIQRYRYCNCYGAGSPGNISLGNWDFCAVAHVGFKNNYSGTDEDDDVQCAVFPNGAGAGEQTNYDFYFTEQFNTRRQWIMYLEAYEDTNGVTCAASCWNLD